MPAQALTAIGRIGNSIDCIRLEGNLQFLFGTGTGATLASANQTYRWYIVKYNKTLDTTYASPPSITTFLDADQSSNYSVMSLPDVEHEQDWTIFASGQVDVEIYNFNASVNSVYTKNITFRHDCNFPIDFDSTGAGSVCENLPFLICTAMNPGNTGGLNNIAWNMRMVYTDA
jgi:hypothetical protein